MLKTKQNNKNTKLWKKRMREKENEKNENVYLYRETDTVNLDDLCHELF